MITDEQYQLVKPIYEAMYSENDGAVNVDEFIARIEGDPAVKAVFFNADQEQIYRRYQLERVHEFVHLWAMRQAKRIVGVAMRSPRAVLDGIVTRQESTTYGPTIYMPLEHAPRDQGAAEAAQRFFRHGLAEIRKHAPYCEAWGQPLEEMEKEVLGVLQAIRTEISAKALAGKEHLLLAS